MNLQGEARASGGLKRRLNSNGGFSGGVLLWSLVCIPTPSIGEAPLDALIACTELTADTARLACFDREIAEVRKYGSRSPTRVAPTAEERFGLSSRQVLGLEGATPGQAPPPAVLHAHIVGVSSVAADRQVFMLDNEQRWQQIELDPDFRARNGQEVTISSGALGSFWLATDSRHRTRVKRIR